MMGNPLKRTVGHTFIFFFFYSILFKINSPWCHVTKHFHLFLVAKKVKHMANKFEFYWLKMVSFHNTKIKLYWLKIIIVFNAIVLGFIYKWQCCIEGFWKKSGKLVCMKLKEDEHSIAAILWALRLITAEGIPKGQRSVCHTS